MIGIRTHHSAYVELLPYAYDTFKQVIKRNVPVVEISI